MIFHPSIHSESPTVLIKTSLSRRRKYLIVMKALGLLFFSMVVVVDSLSFLPVSKSQIRKFLKEREEVLVTSHRLVYETNEYFQTICTDRPLPGVFDRAHRFIKDMLEKENAIFLRLYTICRQQKITWAQSQALRSMMARSGVLQKTIVYRALRYYKVMHHLTRNRLIVITESEEFLNNYKVFQAFLNEIADATYELLDPIPYFGGVPADPEVRADKERLVELEKNMISYKKTLQKLKNVILYFSNVQRFSDEEFTLFQERINTARDIQARFKKDLDTYYSTCIHLNEFLFDDDDD